MIPKSVESLEVALVLRKSILNCDKSHLPKAPDIYHDEAEIPPELTEFLTHLIMGYDDSKMKSELSQILKDNSSIHSTDFDDISLLKEMRDLLEDYEKFKDETRYGLHGLTAQYWLAYIDLIHMYHHFSRSTRTGNFKLYVYSLQMMSNLFFTFNQPNYA